MTGTEFEGTPSSLPSPSRPAGPNDTPMSTSTRLVCNLAGKSSTQISSQDSVRDDVNGSNNGKSSQDSLLSGPENARNNIDAIFSPMVEQQRSQANNFQPNAESPNTRHADNINIHIEQQALATQLQNRNSVLESEPARDFLPMERFLLCYPGDSSTTYDLIQSHSMFGGDIAAVLFEIDEIM